MGRDSSVDIATRYGLEGLGIESSWGRGFPNLFRPALGPTQPPVQGVPYLFPRGKMRRRGVNHPLPPYSAEVKETVELYLYLYSSSWLVLGKTFYAFV